MKSGLVVAFSALSTFLVGCAALRPGPGPADCATAKDVERRARTHLPLGSTRQEVEAWLNENGIEHSFSDLSGPRPQNTFPDTNADGIITGTVRNTDRTPLVGVSVMLQFILDKEGRLKELNVTMWR